MNKYVLRTSLVWLVVLALVAGVFVYRSGEFVHRVAVRSASSVNEVQPAAAGPAPASSSPGLPNPSRSTTEDAMDPRLVPVQLTPERMQSIGVQLGTVAYKQISSDIRATGTVQIDQRLISYVQARFPGYIRKVFANATYQYVRKGQPLFTIYSPELVATQQEYLLARQNQVQLGRSAVDGVAAGADSLAAAAEQRLQQWQVPQADLIKLKESGKALPDITFDSPASGYITEYNALPNMYVEPSTRLYTVADLSHVWVDAEVFQTDVSRVKPGDTAQITLDSYPGHTFVGRVEEILPQIDMATRTVRVRLAIANPAVMLKPGMFVNIALKANLGRQLVIPASAVFQSGTRQIVFLNHGNGNLEPKEVTVGVRAGDDLPVLSDLKAGNSVVTSANFLIDSESQLQAAAGAFSPTPPMAGTSPGSSTNAQADIEFSTDPNPPQRGGNALRAKVIDPKGAAVTGAVVTVKFYMPAMQSMGMSAMDVTTKLNEKGNGLYEGSGKLDSGGTWQVTITVEKGGQIIAAKQMRLNATGGM
jgi:RND family efflux transporter MFP subunit